MIRHLLRVVRQKLHERAEKRSPHWPALERQHLKAEPCCAACGGTEKVQVHHIRPFHLRPELELDPKNLITLCMAKGKDCHLLIGHGDDFRAFNPLVVIDADIARQGKRDAVAYLAKQTRLYEGA